MVTFDTCDPVNIWFWQFRTAIPAIIVTPALATYVMFQKRVGFNARSRISYHPKLSKLSKLSLWTDQCVWWRLLGRGEAFLAVGERSPLSRDSWWLDFNVKSQWDTSDRARWFSRILFDSNIWPQRIIYLSLCHCTPSTDLPRASSFFLLELFGGIW